MSGDSGFNRPSVRYTDVEYISGDWMLTSVDQFAPGIGWEPFPVGVALSGAMAAISGSLFPPEERP